jgi:hypothetical protein
MPNAIRNGRTDAGARYQAGYGHGYGHGHDHCSLQCPYCGPDSGAWAVGEAIVGIVIAVFAVLGWLARHPAAIATLVVVAATAWLVTGPW